MNIRISTLCILSVACIAQAATTIDPASPYAYGANVGWINAAGDTTNGAVIGQAFCSGYLYSANVGWIHLGGGSPDNGMAYQNDSATDYGINHDGVGRLSGYAYGANIGWINFEQTYGQPKVNLRTGQLSGYAYGANVGWINLSTLATLTIDPGPSVDGDSIPDAWEYSHVQFIRNPLNILTDTGDRDRDGVTDKDEYLAGTDPLDDTDYLHIIDFEHGTTADYVTWPVKASRSYTLQGVGALESGMVWNTAKSTFVPTSSYDYKAKISLSQSNRFYRVEAAPPLSP
jgi:hypothetical protein